MFYGKNENPKTPEISRKPSPEECSIASYIDLIIIIIIIIIAS